MVSVPAVVEDITASWLNEAAGRQGHDLEVDAIEVIEQHDLTNSSARLRVTSRRESTPSSLFVKLAPRDPERRRAVLATGMGANEARVYRDLAPGLDLCVLTSYVAAADDDGAFVLVLEDLDDDALPDPLAGLSVESAREAMADLAALHCAFAAPNERAARVPWVRPKTRRSAYGRDMLQFGLDNHRARLTDEFAAIAELYIQQQDAVQELWSAGPVTLLHGDPHIGNLFVRDGRVGFLDWGLVTIGTPMRDVSYFLAMCLDPAVRQQHEGELLAAYVEHRVRLGNRELDLDDAWRAHRLHASYTVVASCQIVTFPEGQSAAREAFAEAFLRRSETIIADLDAVGVLEAKLSAHPDPGQ